MDFKDLKNKTWIDWIKVVVAVDIAFVGFGFILDEEIHILSHIFGFLTRIPFGVMYIFVAILILKRVFPRALHVDPADSVEFSHIDDDLEKGVMQGKSFFIKILRKINMFVDKFIDWVDHVFDKVFHFFEKRHCEAKKEIKKLMNHKYTGKGKNKNSKKK